MKQKNIKILTSDLTTSENPAPVLKKKRKLLIFLLHVWLKVIQREFCLLEWLLFGTKVLKTNNSGEIFHQLQYCVIRQEKISNF